VLRRDGKGLPSGFEFDGDILGGGARKVSTI
jgi:hypothetical protein